MISALSKKSQDEGKTKHVPYRDSKLTYILRNALGGNCNTYMIGVVSPSSLNYDENLSTLRYLSAARRIKNTAHKNICE